MGEIVVAVETVEAVAVAEEINFLYFLGAKILFDFRPFFVDYIFIIFIRFSPTLLYLRFIYTRKCAATQQHLREQEVVKRFLLSL